ncbi:MAG: hypothetical protein ACHQO8_08025, partial [Vicinamibacterales bacterium]
MLLLCGAALAVASLPVVVQGFGPANLADMAALERAVAADPENLKIAADYRQLAIAAGDFDRPIDFLEK